MKLVIATAVTVLLLGAIKVSAQVQALSSFEPTRVVAGESALLRITFSSEGSAVNFFRMPQPEIPAVEGLTFQYLGPNQQVNIINGRTNIQSAHLFRVRTTRPGEFVMPPFPVIQNGEEIEVPAASLTVVERPNQEDSGVTEDFEAVWLETLLPRENLYVGEAVPVDVRLYVNSRKVENASLLRNGNHPNKIGDAFSVGEFSEMAQSRTALGEQPFTVADWKVLLTPLKTGKQPLFFELPLAVTLRENNRRNPFQSRSFFGPSLFDQIFNRQEIVAYSEDQEIEILPLPTTGQPIDFTGGIGEFQVEETLVSGTDVQVGEPLLFSIEISGSGNFDRVGAPMIENSDGLWREYSPETSFTPRDNLGYSGVKNFTFTLIPLSEEISATPAFNLSYFSPDIGEYKTIAVPTTALVVAPAPEGTLAPQRSEPDANPVEARRGPDLLPISSAWSRGGNAPLQPILFKSWFIALQALLLALILTAFVFARHRALLRDDPDYAKRNRARRASKRFLTQAKSDAAAGSTIGFLASATRAIQESVGPFQRGEPESLTEAEVLSTLRSMSAEEDCLSQVQQFFRANEAIGYGGGSAKSANPQSDFPNLERLLREILGKKKKAPSSRLIQKSVGALVIVGLIASIMLFPAGVTGQVPENSGFGDDFDPTIDEDPQQIFEGAVSAYENGDFEEAKNGFLSLVDQSASEAVFYNLGNTFYQLRDYPSAILFYERAFVLNTGNPDVRANLKITREAAALEPVEISRWTDLAFRLNWSSWGFVLSVAFWTIIAVVLLSRPTRLPKIWRNTVLLLSLVFLGFSVWSQYIWFKMSERAIVIDSETHLRVAPTASSPLEERIPPGSTVAVKEGYGDFYQVQTRDGDRGWVLASEIETVFP